MKSYTKRIISVLLLAVCVFACLSTVKADYFNANAFKQTKIVMTVDRANPHSVAFSWNSISGATRYKLYRADSMFGEYKFVKGVKKLYCHDKGLSPTTTYYYKIRAINKTASKKIHNQDSMPIKVTTAKEPGKIAYVGDSVMSGLDVYNIVSGDNKKVFTKVGVGPAAFRSSDLMKDLLNYDAERVFIMLGMNSIVGSPSDATLDSVIDSYKEIVNDILKDKADTQIVVLAVSPTRGSATVKNDNVNKFNAKLKLMAGDLGVEYYDYTAFLKDETGCMSSNYTGSDGIHWKTSAYYTFIDLLDKY